MESSGERLTYLIAAYCNRKSTEAEEQELFALVKEDALTEQAVHHHIQQLITQFDTRELVPAVNWEHVYQQIQEKAMQEDEPAVTRRTGGWLRIAAAAVIILVAGVAAVYQLQHPTKKDTITSLPVQQAQYDVLPGTAGAILTLSNGKQIVLDSTGNSTLLTQGNTKLLNERGRLSYNQSDTVSNDVVYNTMTTTKGKQYQLQLSDGSKIWLNAASSVTYPTAFSGNERKISITGEAYFEIAHDAKKPFTVSTNGMEIQVLGTHFNVNAYDDEENTSTTLLEGSVKIINQHTTALLTPGQQLQLNRNGKIKLVSDADVQEAVAWKDGLFVMKKAGIASIMRQISRWYDVEISYTDGIPPGRISGDIPRNMNLSKVLEVMELSGVHFTTTGKKVEVKPQ